MGMFDYIHCEYELPAPPQGLIDRWGKSVKCIAFQTKDTPDQSMTSYTITADGFLLANRKQFEWIDTPEKSKKDATPIEALFNRGYNKVVREWTEQCFHFNGAVRFYDSYAHADKKTSDDYEHDAFADGWVEYEALFKNGQLIQILQSEHSLPIKYTQQEIDDRRNAWKASVAENRARQHERRHKSPNVEQRLIDNIEILIAEPSLNSCEIYSQIQNLINEYREKHDHYYKQP